VNELVAKYWHLLVAFVAGSWAFMKFALHHYGKLEDRIDQLEKDSVSRDELDNKLEKLSMDIKECRKEAKEGNEVTHQRLDQILLNVRDK